MTRRFKLCSVKFGVLPAVFCALALCGGGAHGETMVASSDYVKSAVNYVLERKINRQPNAVDGHIATFVDGQVVDSMLTAASFATPEQGAKADSAVQPDDLDDYATKEYVDTALESALGDIEEILIEIRGI